MSGEEIDIEITDDGVIFDAKNFHGKTCMTELEIFLKGLKAMGISSDVSKQEKKQAYHEQRSQNRVDQRRS